MFILSLIFRNLQFVTLYIKPELSFLIMEKSKIKRDTKNGNVTGKANGSNSATGLLW